MGFNKFIDVYLAAQNHREQFHDSKSPPCCPFSVNLSPASQAQAAMHLFSPPQFGSFPEFHTKCSWTQSLMQSAPRARLATDQAPGSPDNPVRGGQPPGGTWPLAGASWSATQHPPAPASSSPGRLSMQVPGPCPARVNETGQCSPVEFRLIQLPGSLPGFASTTGSFLLSVKMPPPHSEPLPVMLCPQLTLKVGPLPARTWHHLSPLCKAFSDPLLSKAHVGYVSAKMRR